jgi:hypothetical protein
MDTAQAPLLRQQLKIYGRAAALTVEASTTQADAFPTLSIEAAANSRAPPALRLRARRSLQLTRAELAPFTAAVIGLAPRFTCQYHGPHQSKGLELTRQADSLYLKLSAAGRVLGVPIGYADAVALGAFSVARLQAAWPSLDSQTILTLLRTALVCRWRLKSRLRGCLYAASRRSGSADTDQKPLVGPCATRRNTRWPTLHGHGIARRPDDTTQRQKGALRPRVTGPGART